MTIDHVLGLDVVLADASRTRLEPIGDAERQGGRAGPAWKAALPAAARHCWNGTSDAIATGFPALLAAGRRLPARPAGRRRAVRPRQARGRLGGHAGGGDRGARRAGPAPRHRAIAVGHFRSTQAAVEATGPRCACDPAAVELMDRTILDLSRQRLEYAALGRRSQGDPDALLFVTFFGDTEAEAAAGLDRLAAIWRRGGHGYHMLRALTPAQQAGAAQGPLGQPRAADGRQHRHPPAARLHRGHRGRPGRPARLHRSASRRSSTGTACAPGSTGTARSAACTSAPSSTSPARRRSARCGPSPRRSLDLVAEYGGANSSEHGDGLARSEFNRQVFGDELYEAMREVKRLFDPDGRMNPGKIVDAPADDRAPARPGHDPGAGRARPGSASRGGRHARRRRPLHEHRAVPQDAPAASCARRTWPPATRSTPPAAGPTRWSWRLSAPDPTAALGDDRLHEILDLCLECKACKRECPLGVDMAALKAETPAASHDRARRTARARLFAADPRLNALGSALAPLSNLPGRSRLARRSPSGRSASPRPGPCPASQRDTLLRWLAGRRPPRGAVHRGRGRVPGRLVHHLDRAGHPDRGDRAAGGGWLAGPRRAGGLLRPGQHLQGPAGPGQRAGREDVGPAGAVRRARRADRRRRAELPADPA